jgi:quinol monooxygenase YgiN
MLGTLYRFTYEGTYMIGVTAKLNEAPGKEAEIEEEFLNLSDAVRPNEPGCLLYQ